ncbi:MAG: alcohol dehydrogenase catalytic domain-containing protein [Desulfovermiculus sp.]|nr:alcohol dehydrogenase catalytic domain-containing protein [Desulfovermiculus sp.]
MQVAIINQGRIEIQDREIPRPKSSQVLIRVSLAGICGTDLEIASGYSQFSGILGHEFTGRVVQAPDRPDLVGLRVVADINCGCGSCSWCIRGQHRHCSRRKVLGIRELNGAFAQYVCVPMANISLVPDQVSDQEAVFAEPLAAALEVSQQVHITAQTRIAVLGAGKLGLLCALALSHSTPQLTLFGRHQSQLQIAADQGLSTTLLQPDQPIEDHSRDHDLVVECTGKAQGINVALDLVRPEGTVVVKTTSHQASSLDLSRVVINEIALLGSRCGDMSLAVHFLARKWVDVRPLIEDVFPLPRVQEAFLRAGRKGALKVLINCSSDATHF